MSKEYSDVLWQVPSDNCCVAEPAIGIQIYGDIFTLKQEEQEININYESIDVLCKKLRAIAKAHKDRNQKSPAQPAPYEDIFGGNNPEHDKRFAEENMPDPAQRDEYARCKKCGGAQGYGSAMQGGGLCNCAPVPAQTGEAKPCPECGSSKCLVHKIVLREMGEVQPVQPWMEAAESISKMIHMWIAKRNLPLVNKTGHDLFVQAIGDLIAAHAPSSEYESAEEFLARLPADDPIRRIPSWYVYSFEFANRYAAERKVK